MIRFLLINPPSPEALGAPLLGQQYVAAALLAAGCEVRVIDAAARGAHPTPADIVAEVERFAPHAIGFGLFTRWVWHAYRLVDTLRAAGARATFVAGGAHTTVRPEEVLARGFDVAVVGEAEETVVELARALAGGRDLAEVPGLVLRDASGDTRATAPRGFVADLDALASPLTAQGLYAPAWYAQGSTVVPGGVLASRGCPARCTFCANYVTGRGFRYRSAGLVAAELAALHRCAGNTFFPFWDDAITADRKQLFALCEALAALDVRLGWSAITRASMVTPAVLRAMRDAGCVSVNFGVESGDDEILRAIKKGITTEQVVQALEWAKELELNTACNFMLGFPEEKPHHVERTQRFMERIAPLVDSFSTMGVLVPFPGTPVYEDHHARFGFTDWWLQERCSRMERAPSPSDARYHRYYIDDANLELDFFGYDDDMRGAIRAALRFKGEHNLRRMGWRPPAAPRAGELPSATP